MRPTTLLLLVALTSGCSYRFGLYGDGTPTLIHDDAEEHQEALVADRAAEGASAAASAEPDLAPPPGSDWPGFRGPRRDGVHRGLPLRRDWPEAGPPELWRQPIGGNYASAAVAGARVVTIEQRARREVVACYDLRDGRELWTTGWDGFFTSTLGGDGPRATPTIADDRVYALGAQGMLACLRLTDGFELWRRNILVDAGAENVDWGMSGSPLVVDGLCVVNPGGPGKALAAYDAVTGELRWQAGEVGAGYSSPGEYTLAGRRQLLIFGSKGLAGFTLAGEWLWTHEWKTSYDVNVGQPIQVDDDALIIASGYGRGAARLRVKPPAGDAGWSTEVVWKSRRWRPQFSSGVLHEGHVYGIGGGRLVCLRADDGERAWRGEDVGAGQLLLAGDTLVVACEDGSLALVRATPEACEVLGRRQVLQRRTWNTPAIARGRLLLLGDRQMVCFDLRP